MVLAFLALHLFVGPSVYAVASLTSYFPAQGHVVSPNTVVSFQFSEEMLPKHGIVWIALPGGIVVTNLEYSWSSDRRTILVTPVGSFPPNSTITWLLDFDDFGTLKANETLAQGYRGQFQTGALEAEPFLTRLEGVIQRSRRTMQLSELAPDPSPDDSFVLAARVRGPREMVAGIPILTTPSAGDHPLANVAYGGDDFSYRSVAISQSSFQIDAGPGSYRIRVPIGGTNLVLATNLGGLQFPSPPWILNLADLKNAATNEPLSIRFNAGANSDEFVQVFLTRRPNGEFVYGSPYRGAAGALNGSSNQVMLPTGFLAACSEYDVTLARWIVSPHDVQGASLVSMLGSETVAVLKTAGCNNPQILSAAYASGQFSLTATAAFDGVFVLEKSTDLTNWSALSTNPVGKSFGLSFGSTNPAAFFRLIQAN